LIDIVNETAPSQYLILLKTIFVCFVSCIYVGYIQRFSTRRPNDKWFKEKSRTARGSGWRRCTL